MMTGSFRQWDYTGFYIFGTVCLLILLPACFNYTNISIARALKRAKEIGLRKTMGSARSQIFFQFIAETVLVTTISLLGALLLFFLIRGEFKSMIVWGDSLDLSLTGRTILLLLLFATATGFIAGFAPAMFFSRLNPIQALKSQTSTKVFSGMSVRKGLSIFQFMLSFGFIVALVVFTRQYKYSLNFDFGFQKENILDVQLNGTDPNLFNSEFEKLSTVSAISFSDKVLGLYPVGDHSWMQIDAKPDSLPVDGMFVDEKYIDNFGLKILAGKNFPKEPWTHEQYLIVNETFLKTFAISSPLEAIGQVVRVDNQDLQIIGVLKDFQYATLHWPVKSFAFRMNPSRYNYAHLKVSFTEAYAGISEMETLWKKLGNPKKFHAEFLNDEINNSFQNYTTLLKLVGFLGMLAISISLLGMLGMVVYTSETRTKEVGIRKVLGASVAGIAFILSKDYLKLMGWAFLLAIPIAAFVIDKMLSSMQHYSVRLTVWDFVIGIIILVGLGVLTISTQTIKTASINPAETLKSE
jgi:ABC-type antimicrobial peptide transport system permease subunit